MFSVYARVYDAGAAALRSAEQNSGPELAASACEYYIVQKRRKAGALHSKSKFALPPREKIALCFLSALTISSLQR